VEKQQMRLEKQQAQRRQALARARSQAQKNRPGRAEKPKGCRCASKPKGTSGGKGKGSENSGGRRQQVRKPAPAREKPNAGSGVKNNKKNGDAASDNIASRYRDAVREDYAETTQGGRFIDVRVGSHAVEPKVGRAGFTSRIRSRS
jgi:hypothetical protein